MYFEHFTIDNGLSQNTTISICQDFRGYVWVGTTDGLNKLNGEQIINYKFDPDDPLSISDNRVTCIIEDDKHNLWIGTEYGLNKYIREKNCFKHYFHSELDSNSLSDNYIKSMDQDIKGNLWIATTKSINIFDPITEKIKIIDIDSTTNYQSCVNYGTFFLKVDSKQNVWFGTYRCGLLKYDIETQKSINYWKSKNGADGLSDNHVFEVIEDSEGIIWIGTNNGLNRLDVNTGEIKWFFYNSKNPEYQSNNKVNSIIEDGETLWIGTEEGVINFNKKTYKTFFIKHDPFVINSLNDNRVYELIMDNIGSLWVGTWSGGLNLYNKSAKKFTHYKYNPYNPDGINSNKIYSLEEGYDGKIWMGAYKGGLNGFDPNTKKTIIFKNDKNNPNSLINNDVWDVMEDSEGKLWIGTTEGLSILDKSRKKFVHYQYDPNDYKTLPHNTIWAILEDHAGDVWVGTLNGLARYSKKRKDFVCYYYEYNQPWDISHNTVNCLFEDHTGMVWIGTSGGVDGFDLDNQKAIHIRQDTVGRKGLNNDNIVSIYEDTSYNIWFGTYAGLNKYDREAKEFVYYTEKDGLSNNVVYSIEEDNHGNLWLSTNRGLSRFSIEKEEFKNFDVQDGLQSNEFNFGSCKSKTGKMYFCGINGFNEFHPDSIEENLYPPDVVITGLKIFNIDCNAGEVINGRIILSKDISETGELILSYKDRVVTFEFAALNFVCSNKNEYAFKMDGFETDWNYVGKRNVATYTNLPHGKYTFRIKAANNDGVWNEKGISLPIIVIPPLWQTLGFKIMLLIVIVGIIIFIYRMRLRSIKLQKARLEILVDERTKELKDANATKNKFFSIIAHDLKNSFYSLLGFSELLLKNADSYDQHEIKKFSFFINKASKNLFNLLENLLHWSKSQLGSIKYSPNRINLQNIVNNTIILLEPNAEKKKVQLVSKIDPNFIIYADFEMIRTIIRNLMDNAIKFTKEGGVVEVSSFRKDNNVEVWVEDTGVGMDNETIVKIFKIDVNTTRLGTNEEKGTGLGLILCKEFIEKHGGKIWVESIPQRGSTFKFLLPAS